MGSIDQELHAIAHESRNYTRFPGTKYILPADDGERDRLTLQHKLFKHAFEGRVLMAPVDLQPGDKVLDCGTGPGRWLLDLSHETSSSVSLNGIDIEASLFPKMHPENVEFSIATVTQLPQDWTCRFRLAHQSYLLAALTRGEWAKALKEIHRVLVPGGWIQLGEPGSRTAGPILERIKTITTAVYDSRNMYGDRIHLHLRDLLAQAGFTNIHMEERSMPLGKWGGEMGAAMRDNYVSLFAGMKTPILKAGGFGVVSSEEELDRLVLDVGKEFDDTPGAIVNYYVFYAQKSLV